MDETGHDGLQERVRVVVDFVSGVVAASDAILVPPAQLDALQGAVSSALNTAGQLSAQPGQAPTLDQQLDAVVSQALPLAALQPLSPAVAKRIGERLGTAATERLAAMDVSLAQMSGELEALEQRRQEEASSITDADEQRRAELTASMDAIEQTLTTQQQQTAALMTDFQQQFAQAQDSRRNDFTALRDEVKTASEAEVAAVRADGEAVTNKLRESATALSDEIRGDGEAALARVSDIQDRVEELYSVIGQKGTAGAFHDEAESQKTEADTWRTRTIWFGAGAAVVALASLIVSWAGVATSAADIAAKATTTLALVVLAAYAARQSGQHRHREEDARRLELQLVAFEPFIRSLDEDEQKEARKAFLERFFSGQTTSGGDGAIDPAHAFGTMSPEVLSAIATIARAGK